MSMKNVTEHEKPGLEIMCEKRSKVKKMNHLVEVELYLIAPRWTSYFQFPQVIFQEEVKYLTT